MVGAPGVMWYYTAERVGGWSTWCHVVLYSGEGGPVVGAPGVMWYYTAERVGGWSTWCHVVLYSGEGGPVVGAPGVMWYYTAERVVRWLEHLVSCGIIQRRGWSGGWSTWCHVVLYSGEGGWLEHLVSCGIIQWRGWSGGWSTWCHVVLYSGEGGWLEHLVSCGIIQWRGWSGGWSTWCHVVLYSGEGGLVVGAPGVMWYYTAERVVRWLEHLVSCGIIQRRGWSGGWSTWCHVVLYSGEGGLVIGTPGVVVLYSGEGARGV